MTRRSAALRLKGHQLRVKGAIGWSFLRRWRWWRAERLLEQADVEDTFSRYRPIHYERGFGPGDGDSHVIEL